MSSRMAAAVVLAVAFGACGGDQGGSGDTSPTAALSLAAFPPGILPFASLGLVDVSLQPKPALQAWDAVFARPLARR